MKRIRLWILATVVVFIVANTASYFVRSDGYGVLEFRDGFVRVGLPFLMFEEGGYGYRREFFWWAALGNLLVASITAAFALGIGYLMKRAAGTGPR